MSALVIILYVLITSLALVVLKLGTTVGQPIGWIHERLHFNLALNTLLGVVLYGISFLLYVYLISKFDLGFIIPFATAFIYVAIFIASYFVFKEQFTPLKIMGIVLILAGMALLSLKR